MYIRKKYKQRHQILAILLAKAKEINPEGHRTIRAEEVAITTVDLAAKLGVTEDELDRLTPPLYRAEEIKVDDFGEGTCVIPWKDCGTAFSELKYLEMGRKKFNDDIYDVVKWVLPIALIVVAIFTTCTNIQLNKDKSNTQQQIDQIRREVSNLRQSQSIAPRTKINPVSPVVKK